MSHAAWSSFRERVRDANPIAEICEAYGSKCIAKSRHRMRCSAPYRGDRTPSFDIYTNQELWRDHGTQQHGDVFDLIGLIENISEHREQVDFLAARVGQSYGSGNGKGNGKPGLDMSDPEFQAQMTKRIERKMVEQVATDAALYHHDNLPTKVRRHLNVHYGFENDFIDSMMMGWSDGTLFKHLRDKGYLESDILKTGFFIRTPHRLIEHHELRITFPYWRDGKAAYMISRRLDGVTPDDKYQQSKYKKTLLQKEDRTYVSRHVKNILFGLDTIRKKAKVLVLCEGVTDCLTAIACGYACLSPVTVSFKDSDIEQLERYCENFDIIVVVNDNEEPRKRKGSDEIIQPGLDGAKKTAKYLWEHGHDARIGILPRDKGVDKVDLNSYVRDHGKEALDDVVTNALPYAEFLIDCVPTDTRPAELGEKLSPIYAVIARCPTDVEREGYVNKICQRLGLTKTTVNEDLAEFLRDGNKIPPPPPVPSLRLVPKEGGGGGGTSAPPSDPPPTDPSPTIPSSSGSEDGGGSMPPDIDSIYGAVFEDDTGYYYMYKKEGKEYVAKRISNFVLVRKKIVRFDQGERTCCDIKCLNGRTLRDVILHENAFEQRKFQGELQRYSNEIVWTGTGANVGGVQELIMRVAVPICQGSEALGYVETADGPRWIMPDHVLGPTGRVSSSLVYAPRFKASIAKRINYSGANMSDEDVRALAQRVLSQLFKLNTPQVILTMIGWFYASAVAPIIRKVLGHMPLFWLWGSQGSGKSTLACEFWRLLGVTSEPLSCSTTKFVFIKRLSATVSIAQLIDEFKTDLPIKQQQLLVRILRQIYVGEEEERGRPDLSSVEYPLLAPVCVIGEMLPTEPALLERIVCASPLKTSLDINTAAALDAIKKEPIDILGGHYIRWVLGRDIRDDIKTARAHMQSTMLPTLPNGVPPRITDSLLVVVLGDLLHRKWCEHLGVEIENRPRIRDHFKEIVAAITESEDGGAGKDAFDLFLESLSTYAHLGIIQENTHYVFVNKNTLCLHLAGCYEAYLAERQRRGQPDETNGIRALKRVLKEKIAVGGYVEKTSHQAYFKPPYSQPRQMRTVAINMGLLPDHLDVGAFPEKQVATNMGSGWGGKT